MRARRSRHQSTHRAQRQKGQAILFTVLLLGIVMTFSAYSFFRPRDPSLDNNAQTERALAQAKEALIGYAASHAVQPGRLPCPDRDGNGTADTCTTVQTRIGFLPWKTLGIPDVRDASGASLLYAVSNAFRNGALPLNSNSAGDYSVSGLESAAGVIAVVFAPGPVVATQQRDSTVALCSTTGTSIARNLCPASYLEGGNENGDTSFLTGIPATDFNDRALLITGDKLFPAVMARVIRDAKRMLTDYFNSAGYYPNAAPFLSETCSDSTYQGLVPRYIDAAGCPGKSNWIGGFSPWYFDNDWHKLIFYAVSPACTSAATQATCLASGGLTVSDVSTNTRALLIATGRAYTGQTRPCVAASDCLEDAENTNGDSVFQKPSSLPTSNDLLVIVAP